LLNPYHSDGRIQPPLPPLNIEGDADIFEVEALLAHREKKQSGKKTKIEYLVAWKSYGPDHNTWEPEENMTGSERLVKEYWKAGKS
jgi:hypothetical protein